MNAGRLKRAARELLMPLAERAERLVDTHPLDRPPLVNRLLGMLASLYGAVTDLKFKAYHRGVLRRARLPLPVVSVGNLAVGGTGKTPFAIALARAIAARGARPLLVNKDYGGADPATPKLVSDGDDLFLAPPAVADEAVLEALALLSAKGRARQSAAHPGSYLPPPPPGAEDFPGVPVVACRNRAAAFAFARALLPFDLLLLDDAFQHHELHRDFDVVLLDAVDPWGYNALFPLGRLREPPVRLSRAHAAVLAGCERIPDDEAGILAAEARERYGAREVFLSRSTAAALASPDGHRSLPPGALAGRRILAFSGLGAPGRFRAALESFRPAVIESIEFPDHEPYTFLALGRIEHAVRECAPDVIVTTGKDAVKLPPGFAGRLGGRLFVLERTTSVDPRLVERILRLMPRGAGRS